uniref:CTP synthase n=1 Tax=Zeugodacus cucurbitae TaxID=28588 RepID=A0A0A1WX20_ZEUCU
MSRLQFRYPYFNRGSIIISPNESEYFNARNNAKNEKKTKVSVRETRVRDVTTAVSLDSANETETTPANDGEEQTLAEEIDNSEVVETNGEYLACSAETAAEEVENAALNTATQQLNALTLRNSAFRLTNPRNIARIPPRAASSTPSDVEHRRYLAVPPDALPMPNFDRTPIKPLNNVRPYLAVPPHALPMPNFPPRRKN